MLVAKVIKPHSPLNTKVFRDEIKKTAQAINAAMLKDFEKTTATWKHDVKFKDAISVKADEVSATVSTNDKIYGYVNYGTRPHPIPKRRLPKGKFLAFRGKYRAKTQPHFIGSRSGGASGKMQFAKQVQHPGTEGREFARDIQAKYQPKLKKEIEQAIARAAKKSGHSIKK